MLTEIPAEFATQMADLTSHHIEGIAVQGNTPFACPLVSQIEGTLWSGGCPETGIPDYFKHVLNLYPWVRYPVPAGVEVRYEQLYDHGDIPDVALLEELAAWVNDRRAKGPTLVHCQAGLNRSGLVTSLALVRAGAKPADAIALMRERRSPAVLCNAAFEAWLLEQEVMPDPG